MHRVSVRDARSHLRSIVNRVSAGEEVVILRRGKEVARIGPPAVSYTHLTLPTTPYV